MEKKNYENEALEIRNNILKKELGLMEGCEAVSEEDMDDEWFKLDPKKLRDSKGGVNE